MSDLLLLVEEIAALRKRIELLEAQEDATHLSRLTIGGAATYVTFAATGQATFVGEIVLSRTNATIAGGSITAVGNNMVIDTEGAAASDDLESISGGTTGAPLILQSANSSHDIVVKHAAVGGNIYLSGRADRTLSGTRDKLVLIRVSTEWHELAFGDNSA